MKYSPGDEPTPLPAETPFTVDPAAPAQPALDSGAGTVWHYCDYDSPHHLAAALDVERIVVLMENEGIVQWGDEGHRARFLAEYARLTQQDAPR